MIRSFEMPMEVETIMPGISKILEMIATTTMTTMEMITTTVTITTTVEKKNETLFGEMLVVLQLAN